MAETLPKCFGPYVLLECLGQGAAGSADLARPVDLDRGVPTPVVIKRMHPRLAERDEFVRRFRHEAEIAVYLDSPHVVRVFDAGAVGEELYIALEYVAGWPGSRLLGTVSAAEPLPTSVALELSLQILAGLEALHGARDREGRPLEVVHRDLSPKNVMLGEDGRLVLIDLGLGKSRVQDWKTVAGRVMGSPGYMAPEQIAAMEATARADLYAAAVMIWELFTGERYIPPGPAVGMLQHALQKPYQPPSALRIGLPRAVDALLARGMSSDPEGRPASAAAFAAELASVLPHRPGRAAVATRLRQVFGAEGLERQRRVEALIAASVDLEEAEPELEKTQVWAARSGIGSVNVGRVRRRRSAGEETRLASAPTRVMGEPPRAPPMESIERSAPTRVEPRPPEAPSTLGMTSVGPTAIHAERPGRSGFGWKAVITLSLGLGSAGTLLYVASDTGTPSSRVLVDLSPPEPSPVGPAVVPKPPGPAVSEAPAVVQRPEDVAPKPPIEAVQPPPPAPRTEPGQRPPARSTPPRAQGEGGAAAPVEASDATARRLQRRALALRAALEEGDPRAAAVQRFLAQLSMVRAAKEPERVAQQLDLLSRELEALEAP